MKKKCLLAALCLCGGLLAAEYMVEAVDLKGDGAGWETGSNFLCSKVKKSSVEGTFSVEKGGEYYFWIRTKNYGQAWRTAEVLVNGESIGDYGDKFGVGQTKKGWGWTKGKRPVTLKAGENTVKLVSLHTMCRVEKMIFSDDANFDPTK